MSMTSETSRDIKLARRQRIVLCGSMAFYSKMLDLRDELSLHGLPAFAPDPDNDLFTTQEKSDQITKRRASMRHIRKVRDQSTFGILVVNFDKHGIPDYIGPNTFAEIAVALAHYKRIYLFQSVPRFYQDELLAWGAIPLHGDIRLIVKDWVDHTRRVEAQARQLTLFDG